MNPITVQAPDVSEETARTASTAIVGLNAAVALLLCLLARWIADWFDAPGLAIVIVVLTLELIISSLAAVPQAMLERQLRFKELSIALMASTLCGAACTLVAALTGLGVWSLVFGSTGLRFRCSRS